MRLISINLNKRLGNPRSRGLARNCFIAHKACLVLAQEPYKATPLAEDALEEFRPIGGNEKVFAWIDARKELPKHELLEPFILRVQLNYITVFNCYLDAYAQETRANQLRMLDSLIQRERDKPVIVVGDFNIAPKPADGLCDRVPSNFNSNTDRTPLSDLLTNNKLTDKVCGAGEDRFTIDRSIGGRRSQFRCDLAFISDYVAPDISATYDHLVRQGDNAFTDHSAVVLDIPVSIPNSDYHTGLLFPEWDPEGVDSKTTAVCPHKTAIPRTSASPVAQAVVERLIPALGIKSVLDYGCGRGADLKFYQTANLSAAGYDPHPPFGHSTFPSGTFDLVTVVFVLNVLPNPWERLEVLKKASGFLKPGAPMLIVTRSSKEIESEARTKGWPPHNDGYWSHEGKATFQKGIDREELFRVAHRAGLAVHLQDSLLSFGRDAAHVLLQKPAGPSPEASADHSPTSEAAPA